MSKPILASCVAVLLLGAGATWAFRDGGIVASGPTNEEVGAQSCRDTFREIALRRGVTAEITLVDGPTISEATFDEFRGHDRLEVRNGFNRALEDDASLQSLQDAHVELFEGAEWDNFTYVVYLEDSFRSAMTQQNAVVCSIITRRDQLLADQPNLSQNTYITGANALSHQMYRLPL